MTQDTLQDWLSAFRHRAVAAGISADTLGLALTSVGFRDDVLEKERNQAEFTRRIWDYLDRAVSNERIAAGRTALQTHRDLLDRIETHYGVDRQIVVAIWGLETNFGAVRGDVPTIAALATLAATNRRGAYFESELIAALRIVQAGDVAASGLKGSWAGAMGHTQFMPSNYLTLAVDFDGDGRRDIWGNDPTDALASTAAYLAKWGWQKKQAWGVEIVLPQGFDYGLAGDKVQKPVAEWQALGVTRAGSDALPDHGLAWVLLPGGARGAAFLICPNFHVIEHYNRADAYVLAVGHLGDRIMGGGPILTPWPRDLRALTRDEGIDLQLRLTQAGFDTGGADGRIGPRTQNALRAFQTSLGLVPDGFASAEILPHLPAKRDQA